jgi:UDP-N-acetylmuramoyl-L-alanyl-D-glutamate--2,6-diaminopimelate ligase
MEYDSRKIKKGNLFFALPGLHTNGAKFIGAALKNGASVIVHGADFDPSETDLELNPAQTTNYPEAAFIKTKDSRFAMSAISDSFYSHPSQHIAVIGVTGTEGKSTTVYLIYQLLKLLDCKAGFISTVMLGDGKTDMPNPEHQTTPEAPAVHRLLAEMRNNGVEYAVIESSSHGLSKRTNRLGDVIFDAGVMTNVTHEHLEFHGTWEQYRSDKAELFRALDLVQPHQKERPFPIFGVINADDPSASYFASATKQKTYTYSTRGAKADLSFKKIESSSAGNRYEVNAFGEKITIQDKLPGAFNAGNVMAALLAVSQILPRDIGELAALVPYLKPVLGRMTPIEKGQPFEVVVDYAHTPSSFMAIFPPLRERMVKGRIISLFGSAGERDTKKRAEQGCIAAEYSDIVILSDEDPRGEDPMAILEEIASGINSPNIKRGESLFLIPDRPEAIRKAFSYARTGDLVLLLGKAHENSIIYANETRPYDEIGEAESALAEMVYTAVSESGGAPQSR